jgi:hypothetical protein
MRTVRARWSYTLSCQGGVAATLPPSFLFFLVSYSVTAVGDLCFGDFIVGGESRAHDIASWLTQLTPLPEVAKAITGA